MIASCAGPRAWPLAAVLAAGLAGPAAADEVWTSNVGEVVYRDDLGATAVLQAGPRLLLIDGLGGNYDDRGTYAGTWTDQGGGTLACDQPLTDAYGIDSQSWGRLKITFLDRAFPSRWHATLTACDGGDVVEVIDAAPQ
ncbi:MAG: hypothetical protein R3F55_00300 [Alphaproteobacteria bacterium]